MKTDPVEYFIKLDMAGRGGQILINGVPVFRNFDGDAITVQVPVTWYMLTGRNVFGFELFDDDEATLATDAQVNVELLVRPLSSKNRILQGVGAVRVGRQIRAAELELQFPAQPTDFGVLGMASLQRDAQRKTIRILRVFDAIAPLPAWLWATSDRLEATPAVKASLQQACEALWAALAAGNESLLAKMMREKAEEMSAAFHLPLAAALHEIELPYIHLDRQWKLQPVDWSVTRLELAGDGRLARLKRPDGLPAIQYADAKGIVQSFDMWWRREKGQWIIAR